MLTPSGELPHNQRMAASQEETLKQLISEHHIGQRSLRELMDEAGLASGTKLSDLSPADADELIVTIRAEFE
jgi:uncharacterized protein YidB (DUF937 family)